MRVGIGSQGRQEDQGTSNRLGPIELLDATPGDVFQTLHAVHQVGQQWHPAISVTTAADHREQKPDHHFLFNSPQLATSNLSPGLDASLHCRILCSKLGLSHTHALTYQQVAIKMASATTTKGPSPPVDFQDENLFTALDSDVFPPLPTLPFTDTSYSSINSTAQEMSAFAQLQDENERLKTELAAISSQRRAEQNAYTLFIRSAGSINTLLPPQARNPALRHAMKTLVDASNTYRTLAKSFNQRRGNGGDVSPTSSPEKPQANQIKSLAMAEDTMMDVHAAPVQGQPTSYHLHQTISVSQNRQMARMIQDTLAQLQIPRPPHQQPFDTTLAHLKNNIASFTPFVVLYLNGRHRHLTYGLRAQINKVIGGLFDDPEDAKRIIDKIMKVLKDGVRYVDQDVQGLGSDIIGPVGAVLWTLVEYLESEA